MPNQRGSITVLLRPRAANRVVALQRVINGRWRNVAVKVSNAIGDAIFRFSFSQAAIYRFRALVPPNDLYTEARSAVAIETVTAPPPIYAGAPLTYGDQGPRVLALEQRLTQLGYWLGTPGEFFGDATQQAVWAFQKAAGINPTGIVYANTVAALVKGILPSPRSTSGYLIEINLTKDLLMVVDNGKPKYTINTSTGGGYTYTQSGVTYQAITPSGIFRINRTVDGLVTDTLGQLWRPRFFFEGFAIHGDTYVPPEAVSHGCARISMEAIDWVWANNVAPVGTEVWVYTQPKPAPPSRLPAT